MEVEARTGTIDGMWRSVEKLVEVETLIVDNSMSCC